MASITLPTIPEQADVTPRLVRAGGDLGGQSGGAIQRIIRLGGRYALDVQLPTLEASVAGDWLAAINESDTLGSTLVAVMPQPALAVALGAPVVDGAGQSGATLAVRGLTPGVTVPKSRFFSGVSNGRNYIYMTRAAVVADGTGRATLPMGPKIRSAFADGAALDFVNAKIEGFLDGSDYPWTLENLTFYGIAFTLKENK